MYKKRWLIIKVYMLQEGLNGKLLNTFKIPTLHIIGDIFIHIYKHIHT